MKLYNSDNHYTKAPLYLSRCHRKVYTSKSFKTLFAVSAQTNVQKSLVKKIGRKIDFLAAFGKKPCFRALTKPKAKRRFTYFAKSSIIIY